MPFSGINLDDLDLAVKEVEIKYPNVPIVMVGVSFGSNLLVRYINNFRKRV